MINLGFGTLEKTDEEIGSALGQIKTGYWEAQGANISSAWDYNPTASLLRMEEQNKAYEESNVYLNKDELNQQYADIGLFFEQDTREGVVSYLVQRKEIERQRQDILSRGPKKTYGTFFLANLATNFVDPINIGASFIPVVGQARFASMVAKSGKNIARLKKGFVEGLVGNAAVEPIVYGVARSEQSDYDQYDAFFNIAAGGVLGSAFHVGLGRLGDFIAEKRGKPNIYQRLAAISPENQQDLLRYSVGKLVKGEKVDTGDLIVHKTRIGDEQLNKIDDQINEFKDLYKKSIDEGDTASAKIYLQNLRNLQKTERELFEVKKEKNNQAIEQRKSDATIRDESGLVSEQTAEYQEKNTSTIEMEAENINQRTQLHQRQLEIKDEDLIPEIVKDRNEIQDIDNRKKNINKIKESLDAGVNCTRRSV
tara:strand:+ start:2735 stop:4006 length:1272 start_codon:yes stop_codon:yes gene_type:complete